MQIKALTLEKIDKQRSVIIVGSGMGGGTLAVLLARAGFHPVLIEAGDERESSIADESAAGRPFGITRNRAIEIGGGSNLWHGVTAPLDGADFLAHPQIHPGWPITRESLIPYYNAAAAFLGFKEPSRLDFTQWSEDFRVRARDIRVNFDRVEPKLFRVLHKPTRLKPLLIDLERKQQLTLLRGFRARQLEWSDDGARATAVIVNKNNELYRVSSAQIVLAAGALESPIVLLNSKGGEPGGRYNPAGHVGRFLADHPMAFVGKVQLRRLTRAPLYSDMPDGMGNRVRIGLKPIDSQTFGNSNLYLRPSFGAHRSDLEDKILLSLVALRRLNSIRIKDLLSLLMHPRVVFRAVANRFALPVWYRNIDLFFVAEQGTAAMSRVKLSESRSADGLYEGEYHWNIPESDLQRLDLMFKQVVVPSLQTADLTVTVPPSIEHWRENFTSAAHHLGTMRMAQSSDKGVVSPDLRLYGTENVWICDGSVFPSVGNANPSLTICALAHRLFEHLKPYLETEIESDGTSEIVRSEIPEVLLTGSTGFIGRAISRINAGRLSLQKGVRANANLQSGEKFTQIDLADDLSVARALSNCSAVIHAAYDSTQPLREAEFARRLLEAGLARGVKAFVFFGTYSTYDAMRDRVNEFSSNSTIRLPYVIGKLRLEQTLREISDAHPQVSIVLLQPTVVVGGGGSWDRFFDRIERLPAVALPHCGATKLNSVDVCDVAEAAVRVLIGTSKLPVGFHKFLLNGRCTTTWAERIRKNSSGISPRIVGSSSGLLAERVSTNLLLCLKYTGGRKFRYWSPNRNAPLRLGTSANVHTLRGLDRLTIAGRAEIDASAARQIGILD